MGYGIGLTNVYTHRMRHRLLLQWSCSSMKGMCAGRIRCGMKACWRIVGIYLQTKLKGMRAGNSYNFYRKCDSPIFFLSETRFDYIVILTWSRYHHSRCCICQELVTVLSSHTLPILSPILANPVLPGNCEVAQETRFLLPSLSTSTSCWGREALLHTSEIGVGGRATAMVWRASDRIPEDEYGSCNHQWFHQPSGELIGSQGSHMDLPSSPFSWNFHQYSSIDPASTPEPWHSRSSGERRKMSRFLNTVITSTLWTRCGTISPFPTIDLKF